MAAAPGKFHVDGSDVDLNSAGMMAMGLRHELSIADLQSPVDSIASP